MRLLALQDDCDGISLHLGKSRELTVEMWTEASIQEVSADGIQRGPQKAQSCTAPRSKGGPTSQPTAKDPRPSKGRFPNDCPVIDAVQVVHAGGHVCGHELGFREFGHHDLL